MINPWELTERQGEVLTALAEHGCSKLAARALDLHNKTVDMHVMRSVAQMRCRNRLQAVVMWDRWAQLRLVLPEIPVDHMDRLNMDLALRLKQALFGKAA